MSTKDLTPSSSIDPIKNKRTMPILVKMRENGFQRMFSLGQYLIIICLLFATSYVEARNTPENTLNNKGRRGSSCERGFRKSNGKCVRIKVPLNGKLNALHNDWVCKRGFHKVGRRCLQVTIPKNGKLNYRGDNWTCNTGFFRVGAKCVQLRLEDGREINE